MMGAQATTRGLADSRPTARVAAGWRPLRIAVIGGRGVPSAYSGVERVYESLYPILAERGHAVTIYCRPDVLAEPERRYRGLRLVRAPALRAGPLETVSHSAASVAHALSSGGYDLAHFHTLAPCLLAPLTRLAGLPSVATVHGLDWQRAKWRGLGARIIKLGERAMVASVDGVISLTQELQAYYRGAYGRATACIPNGVELPPGPAPGDGTLARFGLVPGGYLAYVGRLVPEKRVEDLIAAFARLDTGHRLAIVGAGPPGSGYVRELLALARRDGRVVLTGRQEGAALGCLLAQAAAYVSASELEGMPLALLEAMAFGVPTVLSDIPPHREVMGDVQGYDLFFPVGDVAALADRLEAALRDPARCRAIAARARAKAASVYDWREIAVRTEQLYFDVLSRTA